VSRTTVGEIEKDKRDITMGEMEALASYLGISVHDLINESTHTAPKLDKYKEMLLQTALSYRDSTGKDIPKTFLAKLVYLADFSWFYEHLEPMSGMDYRRREFGPVANEYFSALGSIVDEGKLLVKQGRQAQLYSPIFSADAPFSPQFLSRKEIEQIERVVDRWKDATTQEIVEFTHNQMPWQICAPNEVIPYLLITQEEPDHVF
jgi:uncharacterized phage-associated protein